MRKQIIPILVLAIGAMSIVHAQTFDQVISNGNHTARNVVIGSNTDLGVGNLQLTGNLMYNSGLTNFANRPAITSGIEWRAVSSEGIAYDDGFLRLTAGGGTNANVKSYIDLTGYSTIPDMDRNIVFGTKGTERLRINSDGKFLFSGNIQMGSGNLLGISLSDVFTYNGKQHGQYAMEWTSDPWNSYGPTAWLSSFGGIKFFTGGANPRLTIDANGGVGIGVTNTINTDYKLMVNGTIGARKVKVTQETWADFVFSPDYQLPSLESVEKYVNENKHLPDVPSEAQIIKDGQDIAEMNKILLQKVEELTLYIIDLKKQVDELKACKTSK